MNRYRNDLVHGILSLAVSAALCQGCTVGPDYRPPEVNMPDAWHQGLTKGLAQGEPDPQAWWTTLNDPVLDRLMERASAGNLDLKEAVARIREARAIVGIATGERYPDIDGIGAAQRTRISKEVLPTVPPGLERNDNLFQFGLDSTWEIDFWGRITRSIESAEAGLEASIEDFRDVLVLLYGEIALNYIRVRTLQTRIRFARENIEAQRQTLELTKNRYAAELVPELDVRQAELNLASTESLVPALRIQLVQAVNRLGVLLGNHPETLHEELAQETAIPKVPPEIVIGLPVDLLRQRPDIRRAERLLAAQTARVGVATAELYPRFALSGTFALEGTQLDNTFNSGSSAYAVGPGFRWNIFDGGRVRNSIVVEDARTEQALVRYEQLVLLALEDVENAIIAYTEEAVRRGALERSVRASQKSVELVESLYRNGLTDFQNVLDMQRTLSAQQDKQAESEGAVVENLIRIYKALGGGWPVPEQKRAIQEPQEASKYGTQ
jgi:NodT family efflux transporter outer membrane factor (OMF) lipoprotein